MTDTLNDILKQKIKSDRSDNHDELLDICVKAIKQAADAFTMDASVAVPARLRSSMNEVVSTLSSGKYGFHVEIAGREQDDIYIRIE